MKQKNKKTKLKSKKIKTISDRIWQSELVYIKKMWGIQ